MFSPAALTRLPLLRPLRRPLKRALSFLGVRRHLPHRRIGYRLLNGKGLEIGALHQPAQVPGRCSMEYADVVTREEAARMFAGEVHLDDLVRVDHLLQFRRVGIE